MVVVVVVAVVVEVLWLQLLCRLYDGGKNGPSLLLTPRYVAI